MDEILIEDKKYISSKRAARVTGYAKDYVGQLCREGRVPARLVGRSWYVLESAIQDHRFGDTVEVLPPVSVLPSTWEAPRYEASSEAGFLPPIRQQAETADDEENRVEDIESPAPTAPVPSSTVEEENEIHIPIRTIYQAPPEELLPRHQLEVRPLSEQFVQQKEERRGRKPIAVPLQLAGAFIALTLAISAVVGSGYFDTYIISSNRESIIAGVGLYNK